MSKLTDEQKEHILRLLHQGMKGPGIVLTAEECRLALGWAEQRYDDGMSKGWDAGYRNAEESSEGEGW